MGQLISPLPPDQSKEDVPPTNLPRRRGVGLIRSFYFAFVGLGYLFRTQRNARIELALGVLACGFGWWLRISRVEWAIIAFTIALVLILEGLNTAVEAAVDLSSPNYHPLAKAAKDLAAAMVLIASLASLAVGLLILGPPLWGKLFG
ncbi:MAG TPA: diacylglycerol kinase family protein [Tepidisphaeraceae bacterium]|jgi:diacylglycerol kinase|nr:diacylglycerol kinase family protein [Tepidisphaeraceae bacterium]